MIKWTQINERKGLVPTPYCVDKVLILRLDAISLISLPVDLHHKPKGKTDIIMSLRNYLFLFV